MVVLCTQASQRINGELRIIEHYSWQETDLNIENAVKSKEAEAWRSLVTTPRPYCFYWDQDVAFLTLELGFYQMCDSGKSLSWEESGETRGKGQRLEDTLTLGGNVKAQHQIQRFGPRYLTTFSSLQLASTFGPFKLNYESIVWKTKTVWGPRDNYSLPQY